MNKSTSSIIWDGDNFGDIHEFLGCCRYSCDPENNCCPTVSDDLELLLKYRGDVLKVRLKDRIVLIDNRLYVEGKSVKG